jgi:hypothetical protein
VSDLEDSQRNEWRGEFPGHTGQIGDMAFSPDSARMAFAGKDVVRLWDVVRRWDYLLSGRRQRAGACR